MARKPRDLAESRLPEGWWIGFAFLGMAVFGVVTAVVTAIVLF